MKCNPNYEELNIGPKAKCICLAPHPDDESIGCGGVLLKYSEQFEVVLLTDGSLGGNMSPAEMAKLREKEFISAMNFAGIKKYRTMKVSDRSLKRNLNVLEKLNLHDYDYVFIPSPYETHIDHCCIFKKVKKILKWSAKTHILTYDVWSSQPYPNLYCDISDIYERKRALIEDNYCLPMSAADYSGKSLALNCYRGLKCRKEYVEAFRYEKTFIQNFLPIWEFSNEPYRIVIRFLGQRISIHKPENLKSLKF